MTSLPEPTIPNWSYEIPIYREIKDKHVFIECEIGTITSTLSGVVSTSAQYNNLFLDYKFIRYYILNDIAPMPLLGIMPKYAGLGIMKWFDNINASIDVNSEGASEVSAREAWNSFVKKMTG